MTTLHETSKEKLRQYIERLERVEEDRLAAVADAKEIMSAAKSDGFDPKIIRKVLAIRKRDKSEVEEEAAVLDTYLAALEGTPMGDYIAREDEAKAKTIARAHGISESVVDELVARAP